jgi:hypothetical protein
MARTRYIKPDFFKDTSMGALPRDVRLFYIGLWTEVDRSGVCEFDARVLKGALFPFDEDIGSVTVKEWCRHLYVSGRISLARHNKKLYLLINSFEKNQCFHKSEKSKHHIPIELFNNSAENFDKFFNCGPVTVTVPVHNGAATVTGHPKDALNLNLNLNLNSNLTTKGDCAVSEQTATGNQKPPDGDSAKADLNQKVSKFIGVYVSAFQNRYGARPDLSGRRRGQIAALIKGAEDFDELCALVQVFCQSDDEWFRKKMHDIQTFAENIGKARVAMAKGVDIPQLDEAYRKRKADSDMEKFFEKIRLEEEHELLEDAQ